VKSLTRKLFIFGIVLTGVLPSGWSKEFDHASYTQTTLQNIILEEQNHSHARAEARPYSDSIQLECQVTKFRVSCLYMNIRRPISVKKINVIKLWTETLAIDPELQSLYRQEIRVTEGAKTHWIPIQEQLLPHITQELVENDTIDLFIVFIGKVESEYVFIATEFEKRIPAAGRSVQVTAAIRAAPRLFVRQGDFLMQNR
jgi:hypothetical protein